MSIFSSPQFLRVVLRADAASGLATSLLQLLLTGLLVDLLGLPGELLIGSGLMLLVYAAGAAFLANCDPIPRPLVWVLVAGNWAWVAGCLVLLFGGPVAPTLLGKAYLVVQAVAVAALAELQWFALRQQALQKA